MTPLGQVATPPQLAELVLRRLLRHDASSGLRILDPCVGEGSFPQAAIRHELVGPGDQFAGLDVDRSMVEKAREIRFPDGTDYVVRQANFLTVESTGFDYVVMNPPYVGHGQFMNQKALLRDQFRHEYGLEIPARSNLYVYFVTKAIEELSEGGRLGVILDASWRFTTFGKWLFSFVGDSCRVVDDTEIRSRPFEGHLVDASILIVEKTSASLTKRKIASNESAATRHLAPSMPSTPLANQLEVRRGLRLKQAKFFMCPLEDSKRYGAVPFLKHSTRIRGHQVPEDHPEAVIVLNGQRDHAGGRQELMRRLEVARQDPEHNGPILRWAARDPETWMHHADPRLAPIVMNYFLRNRPRHIHNPSRPYSDNFYGSTPRSSIPELAWLAVLNSSIVGAQILQASRYLGDGLAKIHISEYRSIPVPDLSMLGQNEIDHLELLGDELAAADAAASDVRTAIDVAIHGFFGGPDLGGERVAVLYEEQRRLLGMASKKSTRTDA